MTFAVVQQSSVNSSTTSSMLSLSATGAGNLVVIGIRINTSSRTIASITDNVGNTYAWSSQLAFGTSRWAYMAYGVQVTGGATTITITYNSGGGATFKSYAIEFSGGASTNAAVYDTVSTGTGTSTAPAVPTLTPAAAGELIVAWVGLQASPTATAGTNYTLGYPTNPDTQTLEYRLSSGASETAPMTLSGSTGWGEIAMAFKPASGGSSANAGFFLLM